MPSNSVGSNRRSSGYSVTFPTLPSLNTALLPPAKITITQKMKSHDIAVLQYGTQNERLLDTLTTGIPVTFTWNKGSDKGTFTGYVSHVTSELSVAPKKVMEVVCIGASFVLKERKIRTFRNKTITQVAQQIAREKNLKFVGEPHSRIFPQLTIANQSYWEWLHEQATRIGYAMYVENTTLYFRPLDKIIDEGSGTAPVMATFGRDVPTEVLDSDRTLDYIKAMKGEYIDGLELRNTKTVSGVDPVTSKPVTSTKAPTKVGKKLRSGNNAVFFEEQRTDQVVHDVVGASTSADGAAQLARFNLPARIKGQGHPAMRPYHPVFVQGVDSRLDGFWVPSEITHILTYIGEYQVEMHALSDGTGTNAPAPSRKTNASVVGQVDLEAAVANGGHSPHLRTTSGTMLSPMRALTKETGQGYTRTPTTWIHKGPKK